MRKKKYYETREKQHTTYCTTTNRQLKNRKRKEKYPKQRSCVLYLHHSIIHIANDNKTK